jgi:hypothetical protein
MAVLNAQQIKEINELIAEIDKSIKPKSEIGAHDKPALAALLKAQNLKKENTLMRLWHISSKKKAPLKTGFIRTTNPTFLF